jgi:ABC-type transporter Mla subunit MlaD
MKAQDRSNYLIGAGVILISAILLGAMTHALFGVSWQPTGRKLAIEFHDATGIKVHSQVRYAGKNAGTVSEIRYLSSEERARATDPENVVRVMVRLDPDVPPLLDGLTATLSAETLLGEKFVALTPGDPKARVLADGVVIQGVSVTSIDAVAASANEVIRNVNYILTSLKSDYPSLVPRLAEILDQSSSILIQGSNLVRNVDITVLNANSAVTKLKADYGELVPKVGSILAEAQNIATNADHVMVKISSLIERVDGVVQTNQGDLKKLVEELRVTSQNLKVLTTYAKALTARLAEKPSSLIWSGKRKDLPTEKSILESSVPVPTQ